MESIKHIVSEMLSFITTDDYVNELTDLIVEDIKEDVLVSADTEYNLTDVRLAMGRVLIDKITKGNGKD